MTLRFDLVRCWVRVVLLVVAVGGVLACGCTGCGRSSNGGGPEVLPKKFPGNPSAGAEGGGAAAKPLPPGAGAGGVMGGGGPPGRQLPPGAGAGGAMGGGPGGRRLPPGAPTGAR